MKRTSRMGRQKERLFRRWLEEDYPGGSPRFQLALLAKDLAVFFLIPMVAVLLFKMIESSMSAPRKQTGRRQFDSTSQSKEKQSQIIHFQTASSGGKGIAFSKRAPGTLIRVKLLNVVETFSNAPVHAQIVDGGLGREFIGGTLLGDAVSESGSGRVNIVFRFVRHPHRPDLAVPVSARAMSLDGTFGLDAQKKEGFFARAAIRSASGGGKAEMEGDSQDFKTLVARAVAQGMMQEFSSEASVANNRAQVLKLKPMTEFLVELTDYFPGQSSE